MTDDCDDAAPRRNAVSDQASTPVLSRFSLRTLESAGFVALVTAVLYFMGYSYYAGYFARISLPPPFPELSTTDYFIRAFSSIVGLVSATAWLALLRYRFFAPTTYWQALWANAPFIVVPLIFAENAHSGGFLDEKMALFLSSVAAAGLVASLFKRSIVELLAGQGGLAGLIVYAFVIFLFFSTYFRAQGAAEAVQLIEGRLQPSSTIALQTREPNSPVNGARYMVALARGGRYYLVAQQSPAPPAPIVYVIPESEVLLATMQQIGPPPATPTPNGTEP